MLYQILWCLLRAVEIHLQVVEQDAEGQPTRTLLRIEPYGGGDLAEIGSTSRKVVQLKARSTNHAWSLRELLQDVFPDLYRSVDLSADCDSYDFVTEGEIGDWRCAYEFFNSLKSREIKAKILDGLRDPKRLHFARGWEPATEAEFFEEIVSQLRLARSKTIGSEPIEETRRKLWHLLAHFHFIGAKRCEEVRRGIDSLLLALVDRREQIPEKRGALFERLASLAAKGEATIVAGQLLHEFGLNVVPLTRWAELRGRGRRNLEGELERRQYQASSDVRTALAAEYVEQWADGPPILALSGESGQGKTWLLFALGLALLEEPQVVVLVEATGNAQADLTRAADIFWQRIKENDGSLPLSGIAARRKETLHENADQWLVILLDGLQNVEEAKALAREPLEDWGIRLVVTGPPEVIEVLAGTAKERIATQCVFSFSATERDTYLERRLGDAWITIPPDVKETLSRPLLASIYTTEVAQTPGWNPTNEYQLYERFWSRLSSGAQASHPSDETALATLSLRVLQDRQYPWPPSALKDVGMSDEAAGRLVRTGWLRRSLENHFEISHDRLLNFAVAHGLVETLREGERDIASLSPVLRDMLTSDRAYSGRRLGYVPMDVLYLLAGNDSGRALASELIASIDSASDSQLRKALYADLLPTLGEAAIPILFSRLECVADQWESYLIGYIIDGITSSDHVAVRERTIRLLDSRSAHQRRAAVRLLSRRPDPRALDRIWRIHRDMQSDPEAYGVEPRMSWLLNNESFPALRECARLDSAWLERSIRDAKTGEFRIEDLAYLVANCSDPELWRRCKADLVAKMPSNKLRSVATNIDQYRDGEEVDLLLQLVSQPADAVGPAALRALARIDPDLALEQLLSLPETELVVASDWFMPILLEFRSEETGKRLLAHMQGLPDPFSFALVYRGYENEMAPGIVDLLLDALERELRQAREAPQLPNSHPLYRPLRMLAEIQTPVLLARFEIRRNTSLEEELVLFLLQLGPIPGRSRDSLERAPALSILEKLGGTGLVRVTNAYLQGPSQYGRREAILLATRAADDRTRDLLLERGLQRELWEGHAVEQAEAARTLAGLGDAGRLIEVIVRLGLAMSPDLDDYVTAGRPFEDEAMAPAFAVLRDSAATEEQRIGAVLAIGVGRRSDWLEHVLAIVLSAAGTSSLALAGVVTVGLLRSQDVRVSRFLRCQLEVENHCHAVRIALWNIGNEVAVDVLLEYAEASNDTETVALLTEDERTKDRAHRFLRRKLPDLLGAAGSLNAYETLSTLSEESLRVVMEEESIRDRIRALAVGDRPLGWATGLRYEAIRALALFEPHTAFLACGSSMDREREAEREAYPKLLLQLDEQRAIPDLLQRCVRERATGMARAIARALVSYDVEERLAVFFTSADPQVRRAGCLLASYRIPSAENVERLRVAVEDSTRGVALAALNALSRLRRAREVHRLVRMYEIESDERRRWVIVDALVQLGDPGDAGNGWPWWSTKVAESGSKAVGKYLASQINKARKKAKELGEREDRDRSR